MSFTPKNLKKYEGQFIVFFSEEESPEVLFSSFLAEEAYLRAEEIAEEMKRRPVVMRVKDSERDVVDKLLVMNR